MRKKIITITCVVIGVFSMFGLTGCTEPNPEDHLVHLGIEQYENYRWHEKDDQMYYWTGGEWFPLYNDGNTKDPFTLEDFYEENKILERDKI